MIPEPLLAAPPAVRVRVSAPDYEGHSLSILKRIADAVGKRLEIRLAPGDRRAARSARTTEGAKLVIMQNSPAPVHLPH